MSRLIFDTSKDVAIPSKRRVSASPRPRRVKAHRTSTFVAIPSKRRVSASSASPIEAAYGDPVSRNTLKTAGQCQSPSPEGKGPPNLNFRRNTLKTAGQCQSLDFCGLAGNFMFLNRTKFFPKICLSAFIFNILLQIVKFLQIFICTKFMQPAKALFPIVS